MKNNKEKFHYSSFDNGYESAELRRQIPAGKQEQPRTLRSTKQVEVCPNASAILQTLQFHSDKQVRRVFAIRRHPIPHVANTAVINCQIESERRLHHELPPVAAETASWEE